MRATPRALGVDARARAGDRSGRAGQSIGIAVDVTEQRHLALRSEAADMRLRTAIENITESFDAEQRLVMCRGKFQRDNGLLDRDVVRGAARSALEGACSPTSNAGTA